MVKKLLALEGVKLLNKEKQQRISGGDSSFGIRCEIDEDCCDDTAQSLFGGAVCAFLLDPNGGGAKFCVPGGLV